MKFEWDEAKNRTNVRKHGFDFEEAEELFCGVLLAEPDLRQDYGERRWVASECCVAVRCKWSSPNVNRK
jgi:hypothetical protein